jgi:hypothetical protein
VHDHAAWLAEAARPGWLLIHLQRRNVLRHVLSNFTRNSLDTPHFRAGDGRTSGAVVVDVPGLLENIAGRALSARQERDDIGALPHIRVIYEDDLLVGPEQWALVAASVYEALGLPGHAPTTNLRRINAGPLREVIANYDEVEKALASSQ